MLSSSLDAELISQPKVKPIRSEMAELMRMVFKTVGWDRSGLADGSDGGGHVFRAEGGGAGDHDIRSSGVG